eukprot:TRINITY_DN3817_c0_g1_i1.p1 TRINITY_DN3817_c0_g1~~TRINITY_DN3817_c0_g1_i1.p1  ORF type:complete len:325 (-),score=54.58 TRINITY_DN3817_c0_g1_i1:32-931(-)
MQTVVSQEELPPNVVAIESANAIVYLVGTAHVSTKSYEDVAAIIQKAKPDTVILELCGERRAFLCAPESIDEFHTNSPSIVQMLKTRGISSIPQIIIGSMLKAASMKLKVMPGGEFRVAAKEGLAVGARIELGDRPVHITLARVWNALSLREKLKLTAHCCFMDMDELTEELVEKAKGKGMLEELMEEAAKEFPSILEPLLHERDRFLTWYIKDALRRPNPSVPQGKKRVLVAVLGLGHVAGVQSNWEKEIDPLPLLYAPPYVNKSNMLFLGSIVGGLLFSVLGVLYVGYRSVSYLWSD